MIRTVMGDIDGSRLKNVLMHEHIQCLSNDLYHSFGDKWLDKRELCNIAVNVLKKAKERFGLDIFVDGTTCDLGRNAELLREVSAKAGVHIVASSGLYFFPSMISQERTAEDIYELLMQEISGGLDGTDVNPGILKCAIDADGLNFDTEKRLTAVGMAQAKTGLPLYAHCGHHNNTAFDLINVLVENGANPEKIIVGHASRRLKTEYLKDVLAKGVYICIDQSFEGSERTVARIVYELCQSGFEHKLLFSHDRALRNDFIAGCRHKSELSVENNIRRLSYFYELLIPELKNVGCTDRQFNLFLRKNALDALDVR